MKRWIKIKERKNIIILVLLVAFLAFTYLFVMERAENNEAQDIYSPLYLRVNSLRPETFDKHSEELDKAIIYIGWPACPDCNFVDDYVLDNIETYDLEDRFFYVNTASIREAEAGEWERFKDKYQIQGVPSFLYYEEGQAVDWLDFEAEGGLIPQEIDDWFKEISVQMEQ